MPTNRAPGKRFQCKTVTGWFAIDFVEQPHLGKFLAANVTPFG